MPLILRITPLLVAVVGLLIYAMIDGTKYPALKEWGKAMMWSGIAVATLALLGPYGAYGAIGR